MMIDDDGLWPVLPDHLRDALWLSSSALDRDVLRWMIEEGITPDSPLPTRGGDQDE